uniref:N-acetylgalactosaminide beta-1,3-galactosyltransferase n=1 Tax=Junco hyemalis TaxID=40217 RepID=A0A8C5IGX5_JUNHY
MAVTIPWFAEWFLKADDDTFVLLDNLRWLLAPLPPQRPLYLGKRFRPFARQGYMSGGAGYVLSRGALSRLAPALARGSCGRGGPEEDVALGQCLERLGVPVGDSRDTRGRETFHPFPPEIHLTHRFLPQCDSGGLGAPPVPPPWGPSSIRGVPLSPMSPPCPCALCASAAPALLGSAAPSSPCPCHQGV